MFKKTVSGIFLALMLLNVLALAFDIQLVEAFGTIYIRADGSIDPPTAPISTDNNVTYTLTDNITSSGDGVIMERDDTVIDGAGYTLQGTGSGVGMRLLLRSNVTIKNANIKEFGLGIYLSLSNNNSIVGNNITNTDIGSGIYLETSSNNNSVVDNNIANNYRGVTLHSSSDNSIVDNNITNNYWEGIWLDYSSNNNIVRNVFANDGLRVCGSYGNIVTDNSVNSKPLVYLENLSDYVVEDAGQVILVNCNRIRAENLSLSNTTIVGIKEITLTSGNSTTVTFTWNTTDIAKGNYTLTAYATPVQGETDIEDNNFTGSWIIVAMVGDITGPDGWPDGKCDMRDVGLVARHFGENVPPAPANCDLTGPVTGVPDGKVDMRDVSLVARHFGEVDP